MKNFNKIKLYLIAFCIFFLVILTIIFLYFFSNRQTTFDNLIKVPLVRQATGYTCGIASLMSILCFYGDCNEREDELAKKLNATNETGTNKDNIASYAESQGFTVQKMNDMTFDNLKKN